MRTAAIFFGGHDGEAAWARWLWRLALALLLFVSTVLLGALMVSLRGPTDLPVLDLADRQLFFALDRGRLYVIDVRRSPNSSPRAIDGMSGYSREHYLSKWKKDDWLISGPVIQLDKKELGLWKQERSHAVKLAPFVWLSVLLLALSVAIRLLIARKTRAARGFPLGESSLDGTNP